MLNYNKGKEEREMKSTFLLTIFAALFVCIVALTILYFRKRDRKLLLPIAGFIIVALSWGFIFDESMNRMEYLMWFICFSVLSIIIILGYVYTNNKSRLLFVIAILLGVYWVFTYCTEVGNVRLAIALKGYPVEAYTARLVENTHLRKSNISYYITSELIDTESGTLSFFECHNYGILKISEYCE